MVAGGWQNLIAMYLAQVDGRGDRPFLWEKHAGAYHPKSWRESAEQISRLARALIRNGLKPGARVILLAENSPRWVIADFAIMAAGGVTVPVYTTNTVDDHAHILSDSGAHYPNTTLADCEIEFTVRIKARRPLYREDADEE